VRKIKAGMAFLLSFVSLLLAFDLCIIYCVTYITPLVLVHVSVFLAANIGIAYGLSELLLSLVVAKGDLPRLDELRCFPKVALLYVTYNDAMPQSMAELERQSYPNYDIFVLDDSTDDLYKNAVDAYCFKTIRRAERSGFKAGALNNWLSLYGDMYDYFVILDADSLLGESFIEDMVKYAEHPNNENVSIFQSKINNWNNSTNFARTLAITAPFANYVNDRLCNNCETILSWGHNNLHRTKHLIEVGGFDTRFVCEDYATAINLINIGHKCRMVDIISREMVPGTIKAYTKRSVRWAKQNLELLKLDTSRLPITTRLHIYMSIYYYSMWFVYFFGIFFAIYGYNSSVEDVFNLAGALARGDPTLFFPSMSMLVFAFYGINFTVLRLPLAVKLGISVKDYFRNLILFLAVSYYMMLDIMKAQAKTALGQKVIFDVTEKIDVRMSFVETVRCFKGTNLFILIVVFGIMRNPLSLVFNFIWLAPLLASSIVIHLAHKDLPRTNARGFTGSACKQAPASFRYNVGADGSQIQIPSAPDLLL
jgi:cellulose synthase/poly-beta-1,6-N-acetylglucosamine synthase-like glycosyltransferase